MNTTTPAQTSKPIVNPSPKTRFLSLPQRTIQAHLEMVRGEQFQLSADHAMLDLIRKIVGAPTTTNDALAGFYRIQGAHEFLQNLVTLADQIQPPKALAKEDNLDHRV